MTFVAKKKMANPMQVVLIEKGGDMRVLWLPADLEGRYYFTENNSRDPIIPLSISAGDDCWQANCGAGGRFESLGKVLGSHIELTNRILVEVNYGDKSFILYVEDQIPGDNIFIPYYIEPHSDIHIGRREDNEICYPNPRVSREHACIHWTSDGWYIIDNQSQNGVYHNGRRISNQKLQVGDVVFIVGLYIVIGAGYIVINNANNRVFLNGPKIRQIQTQKDVLFAVPESFKGDTFFERLPRRSFKIKFDPIEIESPPTPIPANKIPFLLRMGNPVLFGGRALMTGNAVSAISSLVLPSLTQGLTEKDRKEYEIKRQAFYAEYLQEKEKEINQEIKNEETQLNRIYPDLNTVLRFAISKDRLWERRRFDEDFLRVRIGFGNIPMLAEKHFSKKRLELERDSLLEQMYELAESPSILSDVPIMISLKDDYLLGVKGGLPLRIRLISNIIMQLTVTHSYDELKIMLLADEAVLETLGFVRYLPHNWDNEQTIRFCAASRSDAQQISKYINGILGELDAPGVDQKKSLKKHPAYVIFTMSKELYDSVEAFKRIIEREGYSGFTLVTAFDNVPKECSKLIDLAQEPKLIDLFNPTDKDQRFHLDKVDLGLETEGMKQLMRTKLRLDEQLFSLPTMLTFLEMYGAGKVEHLNPMQRWADNDPVKTLAAPIGIGTDGKLFTLDLHEKKQGPHGLIAGGTGSGKSEFIITYILSMAVNYSPDEVAFVLIDYKGGGLADAFVDEKRGIHLPHVIGTITNLDGAAIQRSLMSINSELKRRQAVFSRAKSETGAGTMDIYDYQRLYRSRKVKEPMPHLIIVSDEFAELKKQQPEFMDELISTARIGRSLGVHLILATQKPTGVVNDQIWSNTKFRICLRVAEKSDSMEMLKRSEAAEIRNTGRFYLQVGYNELFAQGQSAWCGADYIPQEEVIVEANQSVRFIDRMGQTYLEAKPKVERKKAEFKQIVSIVQYLSDLAKREGIVPGSLWKEPLPRFIELDALLADNPLQGKKEIISLLGVVDDPERQSQFPLKLDMLSFHNMMIVGNAGSGKSSLIRTMLLSLISCYSPEIINYYILDLSGGVLFGLSAAPHCGAYLTENNEADFDRLLEMIREMVAERKKLFAEAEVLSYEAYRKIKPMPLVLLVIDSYVNITSFRRGAEIHSDFFEILRESAAYGIRFIFSMNHVNELHSRSRQEMDYRIALQAKDKYEYADILEARCNYTPPSVNGRGMCVIDNRVLEYHVAMADAGLEEQERVQRLKERIGILTQSYAQIPSARALPMAEGNEEYEDFVHYFKTGRIPLGYSLKNMQRVALPLQQMHSISMYFGNPMGVCSVWRNVVKAAEHNQMEILAMRRTTDSVFYGKDNIAAAYPFGITFLEPSLEGLDSLRERMMRELAERNVFRDAYCEEHDIPKTDKNRIKKAAKYIRENTKSLLIIIEGFGDICRIEKSEEKEELEAVFQVFFERTAGYNIYFVAGFYPDDGDFSSSDFMKAYNKSGVVLFFGGRMDKQFLVSNIPSEYRRMEKMNPKYDRFVMRYKDDYYAMRMPCGELQTAAEDPDEASIV